MTRGKAISDEKRKIIVKMSQEGIQTEKICQYLEVSPRSVQRILARVRKGEEIGIKARRAQPSRILQDDSVRYLIGCLQQRPDMYLDELRTALLDGMGVAASISTIYRILRKAGLSIKTITKAARERDVNKRAEYLLRIARYEPHERVYVDESRFDRRNAIRTRAWSFRGERALRKVFFLRGKSYSVLPALSLSGVLHVKVVENAFNTETFNEFIAELLTKMNPYDPETHSPNSVIILDNCRIHKDPQMIQMVLDRGMRIEFLPPYSPDMNPIELCFSGMKAWIRRHADEANAAWADEDNPHRARWLLYDMAFFPTRRMAFGWFVKAGVV